MSVKFIDPFKNESSSRVLKYTNDVNVTKNFEFTNLDKTLAANRLFPKDKAISYNKVSRHGYIPVFETEQVTKEYLFFTKPDLNIFGDGTGGIIKYTAATLNPSLQCVPFFVEANERNTDALRQLQYSVSDIYGYQNPFMYFLTNHVTSKLDLPSISAESRESTSNIMGTSIQYRGHSHKSDNGYDFTLSFTDTAYLELYTLVKAYDEYMRLLKTGETRLAPIEKYITSRILSEQFSIYKFLVGEDGETILFYAKLTGCYFTDVPRSDMSDPGNDGFKYSLSFHAQFVEDSNPLILNEFNRITKGGTNYVNTYDYKNNVVDNSWVRWPKIVIADKGTDPQVKRRGTNYDYRLKWVNA